MTMFRGETLTPRRADAVEAGLIIEYLANKTAMKELIERNAELLSQLPVDQPLVDTYVDGELDDADGLRTIIVGKPDGHYVVYRDRDLLMNCKTTKADQCALLGETVNG